MQQKLHTVHSSTVMHLFIYKNMDRAYRGQLTSIYWHSIFLQGSSCLIECMIYCMGTRQDSPVRTCAGDRSLSQWNLTVLFGGITCKYLTGTIPYYHYYLACWWTQPRHDFWSLKRDQRHWSYNWTSWEHRLSEANKNSIHDLVAQQPR